MTNEKNPYSDILHLPHHQASNRPHMSLYDRAAQFSPFAALVGFDGIISETGRLTNRRLELSESEKLKLNHKLTIIDDVIQSKHNPDISVVYFEPDEYKDGGEYREHFGQIRNIDTVERCIVFVADNGRSPGKRIYIENIFEIHGPLTDYIDEF